MNPTIKKQWLDALRSGKYMQGKGRLRAKLNGVDRFCCLGVLCDLLEPDRWSDNGLVTGTYIHHDLNEGYPGPGVQIRAAVTADECQILAAMNDHGKSFEEIAQTIENTL